MGPRPDDPITSPDVARMQIERAMPSLAPARVEVLGRGWDHDAYGVNGAWVFRLPRNETADAALDIEARWLPWLASQLPLAVPQPIVFDVGDSGAPRRIAAHRLVPGFTAGDAALDDTARARLAVPLARFVRALHAIDPSRGPSTLPADTIGRLDVASRTPVALRQLRELAIARVISADVARALARVLTSTPREHFSAHVVAHGDLHPRNLIVDANGALVGVIDWVDLHLGDRAVDLATAFETLPASAREPFFTAYGDVEGATRQRAWWRAIDHSVRALSGAIERGDLTFARIVRRALIEIADSEATP